MSLANQVCWVVGGVGVIGQGITRALLKAGGTVIVNSRSKGRLERLSNDLDNPERLITVHGSLLPGYAAKTVQETLSALPLNHVVAHGSVRYWGKKSGTDETHSIMPSNREGLLQMSTEDFSLSASHLASLHFSAAQELIPRIQFSNNVSSYTFVTGDGGGHPEGRRSAFSEINAHHVWGLSAALRGESLEGVNCREIRVRLPVNRPLEERKEEPRIRPLSEEIGTLCAGVAANAFARDDVGKLIEVSDEEMLETLITQYSTIAEDEKSLSA